MAWWSDLAGGTWLLSAVWLAACGRLGFEMVTPRDAAQVADAAAPVDAADAPADRPEVPGEDGAPGDAAADSGAPDAGPDAALPPAAEGVVVSAQTAGGAGNDQGYDVAVDRDGNVYVTGDFEGSFTLGTPVSSQGGRDIFLVSFTGGGAHRWTRTIGGPGANDRGQAVAVDAAGRVYLGGGFGDTVDFGGEMATAPGTLSAFVASYDGDGTFRWVRTFGSVDFNFVYDLAVGSGGEVVAGGYYTGSVDLGDGPLPEVGLREMMFAKWDTSGGLIWSRGFGSTGYDAVYGVGIDSAGNVVVGAGADEALDLGSGPVGEPGSSLVASFSPAGALGWVRPYGSTTVWALHVGPSDEIRVGGRIDGPTDLGGGEVSAAARSDAFVLALDADGRYRWDDTLGATVSGMALGVATDRRGHTYTIGLGEAAFDFGDGPVTVAGDDDIFVVSHGPDGALRWGRLFGGILQDRGYGVAVAPGGSVYFTGRFNGTVDFGSGSRTTAGGDDLFLLEVE